MTTADPGDAVRRAIRQAHDENSRRTTTLVLTATLFLLTTAEWLDGRNGPDRTAWDLLSLGIEGAAVIALLAVLTIGSYIVARFPDRHPSAYLGLAAVAGIAALLPAAVAAVQQLRRRARTVDEHDRDDRAGRRTRSGRMGAPGVGSAP